MVQAGDLDLNKKTISYKFDTFEKVIGIELSKKDQIYILNNLFFETKENTNGTCDVTIPSWRNDIHKNIDLIEEIIRIHGYDKIKTNNPLSTSEEQKSITS